MSDWIKLDYITKIEGHAKLSIKIDKNKVKDVNLEIYEGARFFEDIVKDVEVRQVPILTSRICGMCSASHQIASSIAVENAYGIKVSTQTKRLREILLAASFIQSHAMHLFFMVLPDYFDSSSAIELAKRRPEIISLGIEVLSLAKEVMNVIGGREIHSVTLRVGRVIALPNAEYLEKLALKLEKKLKKTYREFVEIFSKLHNPEFESDSNFIVLDKDKIKTSTGEVYSLHHYIKDINYKVKSYSSSKFIKLDEKSIFTSALSRVNVNHKKYKGLTKEFLSKLNIKVPSKNPFDNNLAQAVEIIENFEKIISILKKIKNIKREGHIQIEDQKDICGLAAIDVPRGFLVHEYEIKGGLVKKSKLITPTTQNIQSIEDDIKKLLPEILDKSRDEITMMIERLIRAYDPCISCSTHFLKINWEEN